MFSFFRFVLVLCIVAVTVQWSFASTLLRNPPFDIENFQTAVVSRALNFRELALHHLDAAVKEGATTEAISDIRAENFTPEAAGSAYVQIQIHANQDCSQPVILQATYGTNICLTLQTANGLMSLKFMNQNLMLNQLIFTDSLCRNLLAILPIDALGNFLGTCRAGVQVKLSTSATVPSGAGELISEYVSASSCSSNNPLQSLWISENQLVSGLTGLPITLVDDAIKQLLSFVGDSQMCVPVSIPATLNVGSLLSAGLNVDESVWVSVTTTN
jgi:hypothetical protein